MMSIGPKLRAIAVVVLVAGVVAIPAGVSDATEASAAKSCDKHVANIKVYAARGLTCAAAARDIGRSLNTCCQARFRSRGGFSCTTTMSGVGRCARYSRSYRFTVAE